MKLFSESDRDCYAIIGIGYFGSAVAKTLASAGKSVICLDCDEQKLKPLSSFVSSVYQINSMSKEALQEAGVAACSTAIICIGEHLEASILTTLNCLELEVPRVICKAGSEKHGKILERLGAQVIYPEEDAGQRLAKSLISHVNLDTLPLDQDFSIISIDLNPSFAGKSVLHLNWRKKYNVNIIAIIKNGKASGTVLPDTIFEVGDRVVLSGSNEALLKFQTVNAKGLD